MKIIKPAFFDSFRCIASSCPDSCCKEWDVQIDEAKAALYRSLPGELGDCLRSHLAVADGETFMSIVDGRCPMWRDDGLCRIQAELGEDALCKTCRDFPRLTHDYGDFTEYALELSCPEAARIILSTPDPMPVALEVPGGDAPEYDRADMEILLRSREAARKLLAESRRSVAQTLALLLKIACEAQAELNGEAVLPVDDDAFLRQFGEKHCVPGDFQEILNFYKSLEILTPQWAARLDSPAPAPWERRHLTLVRYFVDRYWLQAISDLDLLGRAAFTLVSCMVIRHLGGDLVQTAQLYSKEIENDADNVTAILDAAYEHPSFELSCLLDLLLPESENNAAEQLGRNTTNQLKKT